MKTLQKISALLAGLLLPCTVAAQSGASALSPLIPDTTWNRWQRDPAFGYARSVEGSLVQKSPGTGVFLDRMVQGLLGFLFSTPGKIMLGLALLSLVLFLVYRGALAGSRLRLQKQKSSALAELPGEDLEATDWEQSMSEAAAGMDFRTAMRCGYLRLLQLLQQAELIRYRPDKSDQAYAAELAGTTYHDRFKRLLRRYEYAWFGNYGTSAEAYATFHQDFLILKDMIPQ